MLLPNPKIHRAGGGHAIVHSKMMVIDPFSSKLVVVTGSHNFSKPASESSDENFVIIRHHASLAEAVAVHILSVYHHYRWRVSMQPFVDSFCDVTSAYAPDSRLFSVPGQWLVWVVHCCTQNRGC